jgi:hypothetical protein
MSVVDMRVTSFASVLVSVSLVATTTALFATGCSRHEPATPAACTFARTHRVDDGHDPGVAGPMKAVADLAPAAPTPPKTSKLLDEVKREMSLMRTTSYRHDTKVDEESGVFEFDCSGFVSYALRIAAPYALDAVPVGAKGKPRAEDYVAYFATLPGSEPSGPWLSVPRAIDVREGDVIAWLRPDDVDNANTGHMGIIASSPTPCGGGDVASSIGGSAEWLVRIIDSTKTPHADDVRLKGEVTGLGEGTIGIIVDGAGVPIGYRWKGGVSDKAHATKMTIARLR